MAIASGSRLGPYEVTTLLGEGGMGKVWRARHMVLNRDDALKVLPDAFASDPERLARFRREAQVLASLNHPNIAHVYGLEQSDGVQALIMELVDGPTLADRIAQRPIPVDEALSIAKQIAEALEAAHEQGIIHRDLKPAHIKLRPDGTVKVLDFGLAKARDPMSGGGIDATASPTITSPAMMTGVGMLLGTAAYMSPEQARGKVVDKRSDIWAFGCVLYEMLTGQRAFGDEDVTDTLAAVVRAEPAWDALPAGVPSSVLLFLRRCLQKNPKQRLHDIVDMRLALEGAFETAAGNAGGPDKSRMEAQLEAAVSQARREPQMSVRQRVVLVGTVAVVIGGAIAGAAVWLATRPVPQQVLRTEVTTGGTTALSPGGADRDLTITPDGLRVIYRGIGRIFVRALDQLEPAVISSVGNPRGLFVSPDGQWVGFFDGTTSLRKVAIGGGPPLMITPVDGNTPRGATWGPDGTIVYATGASATGLQRVSAAGGAPTVLTRPNREGGEADHLWPEFLPDGQAVLFTIATAATGGLENSQIAVFDLGTGTSKVILRGGHHAHYLPTGHLVYGASGTMLAVAFDPNRLEVVGTPVPVLDEVVTTATGAVDVAVAASGTLVYVPGSGVTGIRRSLVWVDRMQREEPLPAPARAYQYPRISPDGTRVALDIRDQDNDIWIWELARQTLTRFTFDPAADNYPVWSPDGRRLVFSSARAGVANLFWQAADGTGAVERLSEGQAQLPHAITPDGDRLIFRQGGAQAADLMLMPMQAPRRPQPLVQTMFAERNAELSPNGRWLAYESNESAREEVYVRPFPDVNAGRWQVSNGGGRMPLWARSGQELFYLSPDGALMGVLVDPGPSWHGGNPVQILPGQYFYGGDGAIIGRTYDISPDGKRFLMIKEGGSEAAQQKIVVVQNFFEELKRLVPTP